MSHASLIVSTAKHAQVARALIQDIRSGKYPVGAQLPSEPELTVAFGVSRQTIRAALRNLRDLGLVQGEQGVGSFVLSNQPSTRYGYSFDSVDDLLQYVSNTFLQVLSKREVTLDAAQAKWLNCKPGERWWELHTLRRASETGPAVASSTILVPYIYGQVLEGLTLPSVPIFALIEDKMGESVTEIRQNISASRLNASHARSLGLSEGDAALCIERRYFGRSGNLFEVSRTLHPADTFQYTMRVRTHVS